jgi:hypothetical protein
MPAPQGDAPRYEQARLRLSVNAEQAIVQLNLALAQLQNACQRHRQNNIEFAGQHNLLRQEPSTYRAGRLPSGPEGLTHRALKAVDRSFRLAAAKPNPG